MAAFATLLNICGTWSHGASRSRPSTVGSILKRSRAARGYTSTKGPAPVRSTPLSREEACGTERCNADAVGRHTQRPSPCGLVDEKVRTTKAKRVCRCRRPWLLFVVSQESGNEVDRPPEWHIQSNLVRGTRENDQPAVIDPSFNQLDHGSAVKPFDQARCGVVRLRSEIDAQGPRDVQLLSARLARSNSRDVKRMWDRRATGRRRSRPPTTFSSSKGRPAKTKRRFTSGLFLLVAKARPEAPPPVPC
jgi:hypothetical protein